MTNHRRFALIFSIVVALASALVPLRMDAQKTDRGKQLGVKLMCMCGCNQILTQCNHIDCPKSGPEIKELDQIVARNEPDNLVLQDFVQEYGQAVLSEPPSTGFNSLAWYIPGIAFALGLGIVVVLIRMWRQRDVARLAAASGAPVPGAHQVSAARSTQLERARQQADRDTED